MQGWWVDSAPSACSTCAGKAPNPECAATDCQQLAFEGFLPDQTTFDGVLTYSVASGTVSSVGPAARRTYSIANGTISLSGSRGASLTCAGSRLNGSYSYEVRAAPNLAAALATATSNGVVAFRAVTVLPR